MSARWTLLARILWVLRRGVWGGVLFTQGSVAAQKCSIGLGCGDLGGQGEAGGSRRGHVDASVVEQIYFSPITVCQRARFPDPHLQIPLVCPNTTRSESSY